MGARGGFGAGGMLPMVRNVPVGHGPKRNSGNAFKILSTNISNLLEGEPIYVTTNFPQSLVGNRWQKLTSLRGGIYLNKCKYSLRNYLV